MAGKLIFIAFAIAFVALAEGAAVPEELKELGTATRTACVEETGVTEDLIEKTTKGEFADDDKLKCYFKCVFDKFMLIKDDDINFDAMVHLVPEPMKEKGTKMIEACRAQTGKDLCDRSFNVNKCFYEQNPEDYFVI